MKIDTKHYDFIFQSFIENKTSEDDAVAKASFLKTCPEEGIKGLIERIKEANSQSLAKQQRLSERCEEALKNPQWLDDLRTTFRKKVTNIGLPIAVWAKVGALLPLPECLAMRRLNSSFQNREFTDIAQVLHHNDMASKMVQNLLKTNQPLEGMLLQQLKFHVTSLSLGKVCPTPDQLLTLSQIFPRLTTLRLEVKTISCEQLDAFSNFKNLKSLTLYAKIKAQELQHLPQDLTELCLYDCRFKKGDTELFTRSGQLQKLSLGGKVLAATIASMPVSIEELNCDGCEVTDKATKELTHLTNLQKLMLNNNRAITGKHFDLLPKSLVKLTCNFNLLEDIAIEKLAHHSQLATLELRDNKRITGSLLNYLPGSVKTLDLLLCSLTREAKEKLSENYKEYYGVYTKKS